ncbi:hypothetical protein [Bartonella sp. HY761]|nr:hypothetical protein [Bartonella sp. HY761]UXN06973.1 hypothetical protein N6A79_02895 [Bartonella sp. HY761]
MRVFCNDKARAESVVACAEGAMPITAIGKVEAVMIVLQNGS